MSVVDILVAEDSEPFRRFILATLLKVPNFQIVGEASDGLEAVERAQSLKPDLILLDIGLPTLSGLEVARRIRTLSPKSAILFVSENKCPEITAEALRAGGSGYVVKSDAGSELLTAVEAVLHGKQFVSSRIVDHVVSSAKNRQALARRDHQVRFCSDENYLIDSYADFTEGALKAGSAVIVAATEPHQNGLVQRLQARGVDISTARERGSYIPVDAADTLSTIMVHAWPDSARLSDLVVGLIRGAAKKGHLRVAACGECAPLLWVQGKAEAAIRLEQLWDEIAKAYNVDILCGYPLNSFDGDVGSQVFERICAEHSAAHSR